MSALFILPVFCHPEVGVAGAEKLDSVPFEEGASPALFAVVPYPSSKRH
jgi:hypothetical protein